MFNYNYRFTHKYENNYDYCKNKCKLQYNDINSCKVKLLISNSFVIQVVTKPFSVLFNDIY